MNATIVPLPAVRKRSPVQCIELGPNQIAWIETHIPNVKYCAAAVAAAEESARKVREKAA